jgi:hypothetical protein
MENSRFSSETVAEATQSYIFLFLHSCFLGTIKSETDATIPHKIYLRPGAGTSFSFRAGGFADQRQQLTLHSA